MRRLVTIVFMTIAFVLNAKVYNPNTLPVDLNRITYSRVINPDDILSQETVNAIDSMLFQLQSKTGVQAMIIAITNIENDDPFQFTFDVFNKYGVGGKETNTGFVITLATLDRSYQIVTGKGLEGTLPDAICKRIENREMVPYLKKGDWDMAMFSTVSTIKDYIEGDETIREAYSNEDEEDDDLAGIAMGCLIFGSIFTIPLYINYRKKYCKQCKTHKMKKVKTEVTRLSSTRKVVKELWHCENCGHNEYRTYTVDSSDSYNGGGGVFIPGGSFGSSHSSGGFGGFGGGSSGGGGAGGRF